MPKTLTDRQIKFTQNIFSGMTQSEAYIKAGYAKSTAVTTSNNASRLAKKDIIVQYLIELRAKVETKKIMSVQERKERLSEIAGARLTDFQELGHGWRAG
jgi:phage terminase small subunit